MHACCRSCFGREFQSTGAWWIKDLSVTLRRERTEGHGKVMISEVRTFTEVQVSSNTVSS